MKKLTSIIEEMGYTTKKGIGNEFEIFVTDADGNSISCVLTGSKLTTVSNKDIENESNPEYFTADINDRDAVIVAVEYAMSKDRSFN